MKAQLLILFIALAHTCMATIITVKQDGSGNYTSIQSAYDNADSGDTILVYPGVYYENIDMGNPNKDITLASLYLTTQNNNYIHTTIIDGNNSGACFTIKDTDDAEVIITGFTIEHGSGYTNGGGGGLYIYFANPFISHCIIQDNMCDGGGGFYCQSSTVSISAVTIRYNYALQAGGGINCGYGASVIFDPVDRCNIYLNFSGYGSDYFKTNYAPPQEIIVDTFTVMSPDFHFYFSVDEFELPVDDIEFDILHQKIEPVNADLYVNPVEGNDSNNGTSPGTALKTIAYAYTLIETDSINPKNIYLSNGVYSPSTNYDKFPLNPRSFVSLIGTHRDSTIFDIDSLTYLLKGYGFTKNFSIQNVTMKEGYGNQNTIAMIGGMYIKWCNNFYMSNLNLNNCISSNYPGISLSNTSGSYLKNVALRNNKGGINLKISNTTDEMKEFSIANCIIDNAGPDSGPETGMGRAAQIAVPTFSDGSLKGDIVNFQLTNNRRFLEDGWGASGSASGLSIGHNTNVTLVNATINGNVTENDNAGTAVKVSGESQLDIYNSIFYGDSIYELFVGSSAPSDYSTTANVSYSNIEGGEANVQNWYTQNTLNWLEGNFDSIPLWDTLSENPYGLLWDSPCIDAGVPMYEPGMNYPYIKIENEKIVLYKIDGDTLHLPSTDIAGKPRIVNNRIDMGAYEFQDTTTRIKNLFLKNLKEQKIDIYPNPFVSHTFISFKLSSRANVGLTVYDLGGNEIIQLVNSQMSPGKYKITWKGNDDSGGQIEPGTYLLSLTLNWQNAVSEKIVKSKHP